MRRPLIWVLSVLAGTVAVLMSTLLGWLAVGLVLLLFTPVLIRPDGVIALSGLLTGFGGLWLLLMANQAATGGSTDNAGFWTMVGVVPLVLGVAAMVISVTRRRRPDLLPPA